MRKQRNGLAALAREVIQGKEKFHWPRRMDAAAITLTADQLELMRGMAFSEVHPGWS